ncbi:MAG: hypothetical protein U0168_22205 [Nannocystaceae bacterium]
MLVTDAGDCSCTTDLKSVFLPESMGGNPMRVLGRIARRADLGSVLARGCDVRG